MIRVFIADDMPLFRLGLRHTLEAAGNYQVVGEVTQHTEIVQEASISHPDIVFLSETSSQSAPDIARLLYQHEQRGIFILTDSPTEEGLFQYLVAGASAYEGL